MAVYNVDKIDNWYNDFVSLKNKFNNTYYSEYKSSYIKSCSDSAVKRMCSSLNKHYSKIQRMYNNINTAWDSYLKDLKNTDIRLAGGKGGINASSVSSKLAKLPILKEYKRSLNIRIKSVSSVVGTAKGIGWSEDRTIDQNLDYFKKRCSATICTAGSSLVEGVVKLAEDGVDLMVLAGAVKVSEYTRMIDLTNYIVATVTGNENLKTNYTKQMWEKTRSFVSTDYTGQIFDSFYGNTTFGNWMKDNAYGFDTVREVGAEIGEVTGVVLLSVVTGGSAAVLYGSAKVAEHTEENWKDENTSTAAGLVKGTLQGIGDGAFFALGMKGDKTMKIAATKAVEKGSQQALKKTAILTGKTLFECGCSVAQDGSNILINSIFSDDIVKNQDGENVKLNSFSDKLNYYYEQAGGKEGLMTSMATAGVLSFMSDTVDISKIGKNIDTNTAIKNADISANNMKNTIEGINPKNIEASVNPMKSDINLDYLRKEYDDLINWKNSDEGLYSKRLNEVYGDRSGSSRYKKNMDRIAELESTLGIKNTGVPESKIHVYYQDIEKSDFNRLRQILDEWGESRGYENYSERALKQYAKTGSMIDPKTGNYYITSTNGARSYLSKLDPDDVAKYLGNFKNSKIKNHPDSKLFTEIDVRERFSKAKKLNTPLEIAQEFNDTKQYLYYKGCSYKYDNATLKKWYKITCDWDEAKQSYKPKSAYDIDEKKLFEFLEKRNLLSDTDKMILNGMKGDTFTQEEKSIICMFTKHGGPDLSAFNRKTEISFLNRKFDGANEEQCLRYANKCVEFYNINHNPPIKLFSSMEEFNNVVDKIASKGIIKQDTIVYRSIDGIFSDGKMLDLNSIKPGDTFNDSAHTSVSVKKITSKGKNGNGIFDRKVQLQILLPEGSHGTYIDSYAGTGLYKQQEILLPRNSTFRVADYPTIDANGVYTYKVELLPPKDAHLPELSTKKLNLYGKMFNKQDKQKGKGAKELLNSMQNNGLLTRFNNEVDDMINKELYNGPKAIAEHDLTHAKNVLLYSMEMGNNLKLNNNQFELLVDAAKYHDVGVVNAKTHSNHAILSSLKIGNDLSLGKKYSEPDLNKLKAIVEFHGKNDIIKLNDGTYRYSDKSLAEVCAKYNVTDPKDIDDVKMIGSILKDADALDRTRFIENIDVNYFRNKEECLDLLPASYELREAISSDEFQKNMNSSRFSETEKNEAWHLFNSEKYPVALINFGLKYYKNYNCTSITNYINSVLK